MLDSVSDDAFARYLKQTGMATPDQIDAARKQAPVALADALVKMGVITALQRETVEKKLEAQREGAGELGGCRLLKKVGEGGMGAVYLAEDPIRKRKVALKVLPKKHEADEQYLKRFKREIEAATRLDHPNIVQAYSAGEERGYHFYLMEYVEGESLRRRIERLKVVPVPDACELVRQIALGLRHAHEQGFVHRDVKPDNIIVTPAGVAKILDLGLAKNLEDTQASFRTVTGAALGTPHYISPEQARGDKDVDGRSDIYSLGATFYHLVTGQVPFQGSSIFEIIQKHLMEQLADPRDIRPEIPEPVVTVVRKMLAKATDDRYADCAALIQDLERLLAKQKPLAAPLDAALSSIAMPKTLVTAVYPVNPRGNAKILVGAAAGLLVAGIVTYAVWPTPKPEPITRKKIEPVVVARKDPPKPEPVKTDVPKPEPVKAEPEPPKQEPPKPEPLKSEPEPVKPEPPKPDPVKPEPEPPKPEPAKPEPARPVRVAVPAPAAIREADGPLRERFKDDFAKKAASDQAALSKKLLALEAPEAPAANYARLVAARDAAIQGGDAASAMTAIDRMSEGFVIDALQLRTDALTAVTSKTTDGSAAIVTAAIGSIDEAVQADRYDLAARLLTKARPLANGLTNDELKANVASRDKLVTLLQKEFIQVAGSAKTLTQKPDDGPANTAVGRFDCLVKEDWDRGLPRLAKGSDPEFRSVAEKELQKSDDPIVQKDLAEGWIKLAEKEQKGVRKDNATERARFWFTVVEVKLLAADRASMLKRLEALEKLSAPRPAGVRQPPGKSPEYILREDLIKRIPVEQFPTFRGNWQLQNGALVSSMEGDNMRPTLIHLPVAFQEEYDLVIEAQRTQGYEDIVFGMASRTNEFGMGLDGWQGRFAGLNSSNPNNGHFAWQQAGRGRIFNDGRMHVIKFEVRRTGAVLKVDDEVIITLTDYAGRTIPTAMTEGRRPPGAVSIATVRSVYRITKVQYNVLRPR